MKFVNDEEKVDEFGKNGCPKNFKELEHPGAIDDISGELFTPQITCYNSDLEQSKGTYIRFEASSQFEHDFCTPDYILEECGKLLSKNFDKDSGVFKIDWVLGKKELIRLTYAVLHDLAGDIGKHVESNPFFSDNLDVFYKLSDQKIVGYCVCGEESKLYTIFVKEDKRRKGYGSDMIEYVADYYDLDTLTVIGGEDKEFYNNCGIETEHQKGGYI